MNAIIHIETAKKCKLLDDQCVREAATFSTSRRANLVQRDLIFRDRIMDGDSIDATCL